MARIHSPGGYRTLAGFQLATVIYDATVAFCERFIDSRSRLTDQMVQAARSGRQNLAEGSRSGVLNPESEIRLTNVARASLEELLLDYEDYLRQHKLPQWGRNDPKVIAIRNIWREHGSLPTAPTPDGNWRSLDDQHNAWYAPWLEKDIAAVRANALICLINQANYAIDRQILALLSDSKAAPAHVPEDEHAPICPKCGAAMKLRTARAGDNLGRQFWGCQHYPQCTGTRPFKSEQG